VAAFGKKVFGELAAGGRFARALKAAHHEDGGAGLDVIDGGIDGAEEVKEFVVTNFDHQFAGLEAFDDLLADGFLDDMVGEIVDDFEIDVGFEKGGADIAHGFADVFLADAAAAGEGTEDAGEFVGKGVEHDDFYLSG